ncbi:MAG: hypothetical protein V4773_25540 [Verrucomicrobiota bacterium]
MTAGVAQRGVWAERVLVAAVCVLVGWFYLWTVQSNARPWNFGQEQRDYYNRLIDGWLKGQLHMKLEVPEALKQLENPYDPANRPANIGALHDASFYKGKYFVYFGMAPVVVLMLPFRLIAGVDLPLAAAILVFVYAGFLVSVRLLDAIRRRYFPDTRTWVMPVGAAVLGLAGPSAVLLRRPDMWELPIAAGACFAMIALASLCRSVHTEGGRLRWVGWAGFFLGLAIASRPTYLIASPLLAVPLAVWWWRERRAPWREACSLAVPLAVVGAAMAWHNYARFDNPLEFGQAYQLSMDYESKLRHFGANYVPYNLRMHFFGAAEWSRYFPFISPPELGTAPAGYTVHRGEIYGLLTNWPVAWLALLAPLALWRRDAEARVRLGVWLATVAVGCAAMTVVMLFFFSALARYQMDFVPGLLLLAGVGMLGLERWVRTVGGRWGEAVMVVGVGAAAAMSVLVGVLFSLRYEGILRGKNPMTERAVARMFNRGPAAWDGLRGVKYGAVELDVNTGALRGEGDHVLLTSGPAERAGRVLARCEGDGRVRLGFAFSGAPAEWSEPLLMTGEVVRVRVTMGNLYPPAEHPFFGERAVKDIVRLTRALRIDVAGKTVLEGYYRFGAGGPLRANDALVARVRRVNAEPAQGEAKRSEDAGGDTVRLRVRLPAGKNGAREPLVVTGEHGGGDFLVIEYGEADTVRFIFDHWGAGGVASEAVRVDWAKEQAIDVTMASLVAVDDATKTAELKRGRLRVVLNGAVAMEREVDFFPAEAAEVEIGRNRIGGSSCGVVFTGEIISTERVAR